MEEKTNIYRKLQQMRVELQNRGLSKSGKNDYGKYDYFELSDFVPHINEIQAAYDTVSIFEIDKEEALLHILDCADTVQEIVFSIPVAELALKGANAIQNVGGLTTYCRRYLYMIAFEIAESDEFDPNENNEPQVEYIDEIKIRALKKTMADKGVVDKQIFERYGVSSFEELTIENFMSAVRSLGKMPDVEKKEDLDLGLE